MKTEDRKEQKELILFSIIGIIIISLIGGIVYHDGYQTGHEEGYKECFIEHFEQHNNSQGLIVTLPNNVYNSWIEHLFSYDEYYYLHDKHESQYYKYDKNYKYVDNSTKLEDLFNETEHLKKYGNYNHTLKLDVVNVYNHKVLGAKCKLSINGFEMESITNVLGECEFNYQSSKKCENVTITATKPEGIGSKENIEICYNKTQSPIIIHIG